MQHFTKEPKAQPLDVKVSTLEQPTDEYKRLARKLGLRVAEETTSLEEILAAEMIHVYKMREVVRYMTARTPSGMGWGWRSCRAVDRKASERLIVFRDSVQHDSGFLEGIYEKPIPYPVLVTLDKIEEAAREQDIPVAFFVSDYAVKRPDPFLMVTVPSAGLSQSQETNGDLWNCREEPNCFVVERWDEPSFRER